MARSAPAFTSGTIATQASAQLLVDLFLPAIESAIAAFLSNGTAAWEVYDALDANLATRNTIYRSLGDRTLVAGTGDTWLIAQLQRTAVDTLRIGTYQDWSTLSNTGNRESIASQSFLLSASELNYFISLNEYEFHCVFNQSTTWRWFGWASPVRTHVAPSHRGIALSSAAITAGTSVVIGLDRDISSSIQVGAPVWVMNRTPTGNALESATIEVATVEAVTSTPNITLTLDNSFATGALIGADPAAMGTWSGILSANPFIFWTNDSSGLFSGSSTIFGDWEPELVNTSEDGADPAGTGLYVGARPSMNITNTGAGAGSEGARGQSDVAAFWGDGAQADPQTDTMTDINTGDVHKVFDTLANNLWILSIQQ